MSTPQTVTTFENASRSELRAYIDAQRRYLASDVAALHQAGDQILHSGTEALQHPVSTLNDVMATRLTSKQRWSTLGVAALLGGVCMYALRRRSLPAMERVRVRPALPAIAEPLVSELAHTITLLGRRYLRDLFGLTRKPRRASNEVFVMEPRPGREL